MELITLEDGSGAPRLAQTRPSRELLELYFDQLRTAHVHDGRAGADPR